MGLSLFDKPQKLLATEEFKIVCLALKVLFEDGCYVAVDSVKILPQSRLIDKFMMFMITGQKELSDWL